MNTAYLLFHTVFTLPMLLILYTLQPETENKQIKIHSIIFLLILSYIYTIPWDNMMIASGAWSYSDTAVFLTIWNAPLGEYLFFGIQTVITSLWVYKIGFRTDMYKSDLSNVPKLVGSTAIILLMAVLVAKINVQSYFYLSGILLWCLPVVLLQWIVGAGYLVNEWKTVLAAILPPTLYLSTVDYFAISEGLWLISESHTIGIEIGVIPIEEVVFFLVTNTMIVFGILLYNWVFCNTDLEDIITMIRTYFGRINGWMYDGRDL